MKPLRVGVVGVGHLGQHHARIYHQIGECMLAGIVDIDKERVKYLAKLYNTRAFTDYHDLIPLVDAVNIAVPTSLHYKVATAFLSAGKDCLLEKPITSIPDEGAKLVQLAKKKSLIFQIGHLERFNPAIIAVENQINQPLFIESNRLAPFVERGTDVDVVLDLMIHDIDIILTLVHSQVKEIDAVGVPVITQNIDIANARLKFCNGCIANITASRVSMKKERKIRIFQKDKYFSIDYANSKVKTCYLKQKPKPGCENFPNEVVQEDIHCDKEEPLKSQLLSFLYSVRFRSRPKVSADEGLEALKIVQKIKEGISAKALG